MAFLRSARLEPAFFLHSRQSWRRSLYRYSPMSVRISSSCSVRWRLVRYALAVAVMPRAVPLVNVQLAFSASLSRLLRFFGTFFFCFVGFILIFPSRLLIDSVTHIFDGMLCPVLGSSPNVGDSISLSNSVNRSLRLTIISHSIQTSNLFSHHINQ